MNDQIAQELNEKLQTAQVMNNRAMTELQQGNYKKASEYLSLSSALFSASSDLVKDL